MTEVLFNRTLIEKYNVPGPRYTSYPTVLQFDPTFLSEAQMTSLMAETRRLRVHRHGSFR